MKPNYFTQAFLLVLIAFSSMMLWMGMDSPTETVCHNGKTIKVFKSSVQFHLSHGDTLGECE